MDENDIFVIQSDDEETTQRTEGNDDKNNDDSDDPFVMSSSRRRRSHHHHHHHHHHRKSSPRSSKHKRNKGNTAHKETFYIDSNDENTEHNFFELPDSSELSKTSAISTTSSRSTKSTKSTKSAKSSKSEKSSKSQKSPRGTSNEQEIVKVELKTPVKGLSFETTASTNKIAFNQENASNATSQNQIATPKTEIPSSKIPLPDLPLVSPFSQSERKEINDLLINPTPKRIQLSTSRKQTKTTFEYRILDILDQSLNDLSQEFLEDFNYYVQQAFSYDDVIVDFITSLNSEIYDIFRESKQNLIEMNDYDISTVIDNEFPTLPAYQKADPEYQTNIIQPFDINVLKDCFNSGHQMLNEIQTEKASIETDSYNNDAINQIKELNNKYYELEAIEHVQIERSNDILKRLREVTLNHDKLISQKFISTFDNKKDDFSYSQIEELIEEIQDTNHDELLRKVTNSYEGFRRQVLELDASISHTTYKVDHLNRILDKSLLNDLKPTPKREIDVKTKTLVPETVM
ncbi:hypothetical protein TRFO_33175 [Tritrichomonas foetus]|uniref:Uncharacterized protein n=1 Tax=Tritrichomonas foetus TaxID=1144522 RepID=A0A1J4JSG6_9EUKA|nr:hypothetical protein TRFO_33175 [Tritrichomonas foetus]|eukprot:OHT00189.1 hypothetical protein TRFO_33175 [Tritrichomonas foetus]